MIHRNDRTIVSLALAVVNTCKPTLELSIRTVNDDCISGINSYYNSSCVFTITVNLGIKNNFVFTIVPVICSTDGTYTL